MLRHSSVRGKGWTVRGSVFAPSTSQPAAPWVLSRSRVAPLTWSMFVDWRGHDNITAWVGSRYMDHRGKNGKRRTSRAQSAFLLFEARKQVKHPVDFIGREGDFR